MHVLLPYAFYCKPPLFSSLPPSLPHIFLPPPFQPGQRALLLDIGCGSGLSGEAIEEAGHAWIGCDISKDMLALAAEKESDGGYVLTESGT